MKLLARTESWAFKTPFRISRGEMTALDVIVVELTSHDGLIGRGEAAGVDYDGETIASMLAQIDAVDADAEGGLSREQLLGILPAGGARNAIDCALWDLEAATRRIPVWQLLARRQPAALSTAFTIGIGDEAEVREKARSLAHWPLIKLKMDDRLHIDLARIVHEEAPAAKLICDANQAWDINQLNALAPALSDLGTALIEQPLPKNADSDLKHYNRAIAIAADESCTDRGSVARLSQFYDVVNIKLDKTGGLTEALAVAEAAKHHGMGVMVGCMAGTSLAMAPAFLVAQGAAFVDLDGPLLHTADRPGGFRYDNGAMYPFDALLWGGGAQAEDSLAMADDAALDLRPGA